MAIIRRVDPAGFPRRVGDWEPFQLVRDLVDWVPFRERTPRLFRAAQAFAPPVDVKETRDAYTFKVDVPGIQEQDLSISVNGDRLTLTGKRDAEHVEETETYYRSERSYGSFSRSFRLPQTIDAEQVSAELADGILTLRVPKVEAAQPKRIPIQTATGGEPAPAELQARTSSANAQASTGPKASEGAQPGKSAGR
jgi:HSP20 family protein